MALLDEIGTRLADQGIASSSGADGWLLIKSQLPDSTTVQDKAVAILRTGGQAPEARVDLDRASVQAVVRGSSILESSTGYEEAEAEAQAVKWALHEFSGTLSGRHYVGIWAQQDPFFAGYDQKRRPMFSVNFRAWRSRPAVSWSLDLPGTNGNYASTPDSAALSVTGDIDVRAKVALDDWASGSPQSLMAKWAVSGDQRSYNFHVGTTGLLGLQWSNDGVATGLIALSSEAIPIGDGETLWVRATLDMDDGAGNHVVTFYTSTDGTTWTQLGTVQTQAGTTSIFDGTSDATVGAINAGALQNAAGKVYRAQVYDGIDGTLVFDADFADYTTFGGTNTWTEQSGNGATVTANGDDWQYLRSIA